MASVMRCSASCLGSHPVASFNRPAVPRVSTSNVLLPSVPQPAFTQTHFACAASLLSVSHVGARLVCPSLPELHPGETQDQALQRRLQESMEVEERVISIYSERDFQQQLAAAGDKLVLLEVQSPTVCETGFDEEPEDHWKFDAKKREELQMAKCSSLKSTFHRTARSCHDVVFLALEAEGDEAEALCDKLKVETLPTIQFYRNSKLLWSVAGTQDMADGAALGEGVLYYGNALSDGKSANEYVVEVESGAQLRSFLSTGDPNELKVLDVCLSDGLGCIRVYPAVVALAKSFAGYASFGRLLGDANRETQALLRDMDIKQVPTFIFYRGEREVGRHVGSSRGDLIGQILQVQAAAGISPPPPPANAPKRSFRKRA